MKKRYIVPKTEIIYLQPSGSIADGDDAWDGFVGVSNRVLDPNSPEMSKGGTFFDDIDDEDWSDEEY